MAKKKAQGMLAKASAFEQGRLTPGQQAKVDKLQARGKSGEKAMAKFQSKNEKAYNKDQWKRSTEQSAWESRDQASLKNQKEADALELQGGISGAQDRLMENMQKPWDPASYYEGLPQNAPEFDRNRYDDQSQRALYEDKVYQNYMRNAEPEMKRQTEDFEQMAFNRGWTPGSAIYEQQKKALVDNQENQKQNIRTQAMQESGTEWERGLNAYGQGYQGSMGNINDKYTMANAQKGIGWEQMTAPGQQMQYMQGLQYNPENDVQRQWQAGQNAADRRSQYKIATAPGRGGGGGSPEMSPDDQLAFYEAQQAINAKYRQQPQQPKGPGVLDAALGLGGAALGGWASSGFPKFW